MKRVVHTSSNVFDVMLMIVRVLQFLYMLCIASNGLAVIQLAEAKLESEDLSTGQEDAEAGTLEEYVIVLLFELYEGNGAQRRLCWWGKEAQDPDNGALILAESGDFESYQATDCPTEILRPGLTREWVGEGELPKERTCKATDSRVMGWQRHSTAKAGHPWSHRSLALMEGEHWS
ncbi:hypothetical protein BHM03_00031614 [Ensete ventricosum]|nr:hypothetical protein BHM03_00031614 [Ensete ventricosum]